MESDNVKADYVGENKRSIDPDNTTTLSLNLPQIRIAKITGWGYREILEDLPFAAGLQIIHADDAAHGRKRTWTRNSRKVDFDSLAAIDAAFAKIT